MTITEDELKIEEELAIVNFIGKVSIKTAEISLQKFFFGLFLYFTMLAHCDHPSFFCAIRLHNLIRING